MTREIKFRAWVKQEDNYALGIKKDHMMYDVLPMPAPNSGFFVKATYNGKEVMKSRTNFLSEQEYNGEVMQFTGLKDKNGKEIYEGDIVKNVSKESAMFFGHITEIVYEAPQFVKKDKEGKYYTLFAGYSLHEVIGNIYENPELLK